MQRRAAALYAAFFLVLSVASYGMIATASPPPVSVDDPDVRQSTNGQFDLGGQTYDVSIDAEQASATISWVDESARHTATWEADSTVTVDGTNFSVATDANATPPSVRLVEERPLRGVATTTVDGTDYVVLPNRTLVPVNDYRDRVYGPAETRTLAAGDTFDYRGNATTVATVTDGAATLEWTAPAARSEEVSEGDTVDLAGDTYVAHFPNPRTLVLDSDLEAYEAELAVQDTYDERINGLWGVSLLSTIAVVLLLGLSYLPSRY